MRSRKFFFILAAVLVMTGVRAQELLNYPLDTIDGEEVYKYEVERSIGLYRIGVNFNVPQSEIIRLNPQLKERGLHYAELLYIPTGRPIEPKVVESQPTVVETQITETRVIGDTARALPALPSALPLAPSLQDNEPTVRKTVELALMLPFESQQTKRSGNAERMLELYQGALIALHDMQNDSTLYRLRVYDSERSELRVKALTDSTELDSVQGILGLVYPIQIERMAAWCDEHKVPLLLPFSDALNLSNKPQLMQFNSTDEQEADSLCQWMKEHPDAHFVAIETKDTETAYATQELRNRMKKNGVTYTGMALRDLLTDSCDYALDASKENIFIMHSDRLNNVRVVLPHLTRLQENGYRIRIIGQYSWVKENIGIPMVYTSVFTVTEGREAYEAMWEKYYAGSHVSETPRYDLLGYDLMKALVGRLQGAKVINGLQSDIHWQQVGAGGWQNTNVRVIEN